MKKETLEEAAEKYIPNPMSWTIKEIFKDGAKWQQERSYNDEEVLKFLKDCLQNYDLRNGRLELKEWFEQFKKK